LAFSCNTISECKKAADTISHIYIEFDFVPEFYYQTILGLNDNKELEDLLLFILENSKFQRNVTLLGYKDFGFGKDKSFKDASKWIEIIKSINSKNRYKKLTIGIDSIVVKQYKQELLDSGINYRNLVGEEGKFSCYIDCVKNTISASSFTDKTFDFDSNWLQTFKSF